MTTVGNNKHNDWYQFCLDLAMTDLGPAFDYQILLARKKAERQFLLYKSFVFFFPIYYKIL